MMKRLLNEADLRSAKLPLIRADILFDRSAVPQPLEQVRE
jgi:hypothetical protein